MSNTRVDTALRRTEVGRDWPPCPSSVAGHSTAAQALEACAERLLGEDEK